MTGHALVLDILPVLTSQKMVTGTVLLHSIVALANNAQ